MGNEIGINFTSYMSYMHFSQSLMASAKEGSLGDINIFRDKNIAPCSNQHALFNIHANAQRGVLGYSLASKSASLTISIR